MMTPSKEYLGLPVHIFEEKGLEYVIFSPGSRNAPLIIAFTASRQIRSLKIQDERSAAYFALGMAQQTGKPVAIACTSGTAALNYAPAIAEAYYQKIPLLVLTADRPAEWIDEGDGQTIRQTNLYANFIKKSFTFPQHIVSDDDRWYAMHIANEAFDISMYPEPGPVHINFPFTEPLYRFTPDLKSPVQNIRPAYNIPDPDDSLIQQLADRWNRAGKKIILTGLLYPDSSLEGYLAVLAEDPSVVILTETTSNLHTDSFIPGIDKVVSTISDKEAGDFTPDILVTFGGHIVSKMIKAFLRNHPPKEHWHISPSAEYMDTFRSLNRVIRTTSRQFFSSFLPATEKGKGNFALLWNRRDKRSEERHTRFLGQISFSDLKAFDIIFRSLPEKSMVQLGNSTPVRYSQLYRIQKRFSFYSNRGVSGIDGCVSTAAGAAFVTGKETYLITGDIAFFYDMNGLWHNYLSDRLKIIMINNGGGGIFRFIDGPDTTGQLDYFETPYSLHAAYVASLYGLDYFRADNEESLRQGLHKLIKAAHPALLEVTTPREENGVILREYFRNLKKSQA